MQSNILLFNLVLHINLKSYEKQNKALSTLKYVSIVKLKYANQKSSSAFNINTMNKIIFTDEAENNLTKMLDGISERFGINIRNRVLNDIKKTVESAARYPEFGNLYRNGIQLCSIETPAK